MIEKHSSEILGNFLKNSQKFIGNFITVFKNFLFFPDIFSITLGKFMIDFSILTSSVYKQGRAMQ